VKRGGGVSICAGEGFYAIKCLSDGVEGNNCGPSRGGPMRCHPKKKSVPLLRDQWEKKKTKNEKDIKFFPLNRN